MPRPRLRFREFLLLVTLISLVTAGISIRWRTADLLFVQDHAALAEQARNQVETIDRQTSLVKELLARPSQVSMEWASRFEFRVIPNTDHPEDLFKNGQPPTGRSLVLVTTFDKYRIPWIRVFDAAGKEVVNHTEWDHQGCRDFTNRLAAMGSPHKLTSDEKLWILGTLSTFVDNRRASQRTYLKILASSRVKTIAEAEMHEQLAQRP